jgi:hypothetical protein
VKGEIYQPVSVVPPVTITPKLSTVVSTALKNTVVEVEALRNIVLQDSKIVSTVPAFTNNVLIDENVGMNGSISLYKGQKKTITVFPVSGKQSVIIGAQENTTGYNQQLKSINYDHIPSINYLKKAKIEFKILDVKTEGSIAGYIPGAGDKVPGALEQMGYKVVLLKESDITTENIKQFDVIITGVRAYNTNDWMNNVYDVLMQYVKNGGVLVSQYNTSSQIGPVKAKIAPYNFTIGRNRITDEEAKVNFLLPNHAVLNFPNKITDKDFEGWVQERSIYHAENIDTAYKKIFSMHDAGEKDQDGSLIIADYGKGRFVYTGLVFFRELPAGVPGAYRLFANVIANSPQRPFPEKAAKTVAKKNIISKSKKQ